MAQKLDGITRSLWVVSAFPEHRAAAQSANLPVESGARNGGYRGEKRPLAAVRAKRDHLPNEAKRSGLRSGARQRSGSTLGGARSSRSVRPASSVELWHKHRRRTIRSAKCAGAR